MQKPSTGEIKRKAEVNTISGDSGSMKTKSMRRDIDPLDPFGGKVWMTHRKLSKYYFAIVNVRYNNIL